MSALGSRLAILLQMAAATVASVVAILGLATWMPSPDADELTERLAYILRFDLAPLAVYAAMIGWIAAQRFFLRGDAGWSGARDGLPSSTEIDLRVVQNTTEQLLLFLPIQIALAVTGSGLDLKLLAAVALWFAFARLLFWIGYHLHPAARAFGFAATFYPTLYLLIAGIAAAYRAS